VGGVKTGKLMENNNKIVKEIIWRSKYKGTRSSQVESLQLNWRRIGSGGCHWRETGSH